MTFWGSIYENSTLFYAGKADSMPAEFPKSSTFAEPYRDKLFGKPWAKVVGEACSQVGRFQVLPIPETIPKGAKRRTLASKPDNDLGLLHFKTWGDDSVVSFLCVPLKSGG